MPGRENVAPFAIRAMKITLTAALVHVRTWDPKAAIHAPVMIIGVTMKRVKRIVPYAVPGN